MGFTVNRAEGLNREAEFEVYARLLRQRGIDLGKLPRAPEPGTRNRWLYVWNSKAEADAFADELKKRTGDNGWEVIPVDAALSEGPLGPIIIQVGRRSNGLVFGLHPLSRAMIQSAFPDADPPVATIEISFETLQDFLKTYGTIGHLAEEIVPKLTGLNQEQLTALGYALIEDDTGRTLAFVRPGDLVQASEGSPSAPPA
jgi:hypothetical protein